MIDREVFVLVGGGAAITLFGLMLDFRYTEAAIAPPLMGRAPWCLHKMTALSYLSEPSTGCRATI